MPNSRLRLAALVLGWGLIGGPAQCQGPQRDELVLVRVTPQGVYLSQTVLRPGKVTFIVLNATPLPQCSLDIVPVAANGARGPATKVAEGKTNRKWTAETVLTPGSYRITVNGISQLEAGLTVGNR
ncbi:MAG: hypothetical protein HY820_16745 [Acidobacteria bacterium]|nr:hypothetical protein [Acidobacteriota bacterium]